MVENTPLAPSESFADLRSEVIERGTAPEKPKRGRPKKSVSEARDKSKITTASAPRPDFVSVETMIQIVSLPFDLYAKRAGDHWKLSDEEKKQIGELSNRVLNKHVPSWIDAWGDEIALCTVLGMVVIGRYMVDIANREKLASEVFPPLTPNAPWPIQE